MTAGAKGGREAEPSGEGQHEARSPEVPAAGKQGEEDLWQRHKVERGVWSEKMLVALEKGVKGAEQQRDRQPTGCPAGVSESESKATVGHSHRARSRRANRSENGY